MLLAYTVRKPSSSLLGLMTTGIARSHAQTPLAPAKFDSCTIPTEKFTASTRTIDQLWQQASELLDLKQHSEAIAILDLIVQLQPNSFLAWHWRGNSLATLGQYEEAIASYNRAIQIKPNYLLARFEKSTLLISLGLARFVFACTP